MARRINRNKSLGFTLIELLVVVGILAILSALIFPVIQRADIDGRQSAVSSNLRSINFAYQLYLLGSDDHLPYASDDCYHQDKVCHAYPQSFVKYVKQAPAISAALKPYTSEETMWEVPVGYGIPDYKLRSSDYLYPYGVPGAPNTTSMQLEALRCPLFHESDHYIFDGGHLPISEKSRYMTVYLDGSVSYLNQIKVFDQADACSGALTG